MVDTFSDNTAVAIAARVRAGRQSPVDATQRALECIASRDRELGAFRQVRAAEAMAEAHAVAARPDLATLPLAGVPIAIKDSVAVAGESTRHGSAATSPAPAPADHEVVRRLRAAGAVVVGLTSVPELCVFGTTDSSFGITRNPWNRDRTPGGSSGGSAAAVASGMIPLAHGTDGMGSIRIPAANCGLFGLKPGRDVVPSGAALETWHGMSESGPLATTVADAALMLSVLAGRPSLANPDPAPGLRIGVAANTPSPLVRLDKTLAGGLERVADELIGAGHQVARARLPYPASPVGLLARWTRGVYADAEGLDQSLLAPRTRRHAQLGALVERFGLATEAQARRLTSDFEEFFQEFDVVITPTLAQPAPAAERWSEKSWLSNTVSNVRYASYPAVWNMLGWPAASVPAGISHRTGLPMAVQIGGLPGSEGTILALAAQIEQLLPWERVAPHYR
ncbi:amidase [Tomitella biformata]|uniref:amidase n=1 Tax=Tomitella biformata TaxID=630403 RepID=UPI000464D149|nr:amidase [Tomitella biformata]